MIISLKRIEKENVEICYKVIQMKKKKLSTVNSLYAN